MSKNLADSSLGEVKNNVMDEILDKIQTLIAYLDADFYFIRVNRAFINGFGFSKELLIDHNYFELFPDPMVEAIFTRVKQTNLAETFRAMVFKHQEATLWDWSFTPLQDGRGFILELTDATNQIRINQGFEKFTPIWDQERQVVAAVPAFSDITDRKQIELARQLQQIIEFLPDAIFVLDQERKVIAWNRAIELLTGVTKAEIIGKGDYAYAVPFYGSPQPILIDLCWENTAGTSGEEQHIEIEGDTFYTEIFVPALNQGKGSYLAIKATPLKDNQGRITGAIASIRDKTRQHEMEEESFKTQKIESIGILAGGIAHDFNNFLAGILANVQLVKMKLNKGLAVEKSLNSIEEMVSKAADLTRQLLTFSKGGAPIKKTMKLKNLLHDNAEFALRGSKSRCIFSIPDNLWPVAVDAGQISQVISNLIINADQAMINGGLLRLKAENIVLDEMHHLPLPPGKYIKLTIKDQGEGIAKENLKKIFDPYFTTKNKGNGLGLTTSYAIIHNHNGYINVESQVGQGTSFYIYLPAVTETADCGSIVEPTCYHGNGRVLIMDDEDIIRDAAAEMLSEMGYHVSHAKDGNEAIRIYLEARKAGTPFDVVIMDLTVPGGLGGKETVAELLKYDPDIKAIVSSGYSNGPVMSNYREYGFSGVVAKPYKIEELSMVLRQVLPKREDDEEFERSRK